MRMILPAAAILLLAAALAAAPPVAAAPPPVAALAENAEAEGLIAAEDARFAAQIRGDTQAVAEGMADELVYTHASGNHQTKAEYLAALAAGRSPYRSITPQNRVAEVFGRAGYTRADLTMLVGDMVLTSSYLGVYIRRDGRWQLLVWQTTGPPHLPVTPGK